MEGLYLLIPLAPLAAALLVGLFGKQVGQRGAHSVTIAAVALSFVLSVWAFWHITLGGAAVYNESLYTWGTIGTVQFEIGFLIDNLTILMMLMVTFVSLVVHVYSIAYMRDEPGYQRFFSYLAFFTFAMLMLVMSNNFLQLFFGWEAVGLASYLLIGFWFKKDKATAAGMKAFLVNRVGDLGFLLGIAVIFVYTKSLEYTAVFHSAGVNVLLPTEWGFLHKLIEIKSLDLAMLLLFVGAMGKSAQIPLHVWLADSMEGPTPVSALIHAATMVTAGVFMIARLSPLYEQSEIALNIILVVGATTAFLMGLVAIVQTDIKRVIAYSTLSQLGYMVAALGASAYSVAMFHLMTHAFFKALLFLVAGSVIMAMHHEQDMRKMGGLRRHMPITHASALVGVLALVGFPTLAGFFSKDLILEAVQASTQPLATYAYSLLLLSVFVTAFYAFRFFFMVFYGDERMEDDILEQLQESPPAMTVPLILLAIPATLAGFLISVFVFGELFDQILLPAIGSAWQDVATITVISDRHPAMNALQLDYYGVLSFIGHGLLAWPFWLMLAGVGAAWYIYLKNDAVLDWAHDHLQGVSKLLQNAYYFNQFYKNFFVNGMLHLGNSLWALGDRLIIDGVFVNGISRLLVRGASIMRYAQTGRLYQYVLLMVLGLLLLSAWVFQAVML